MTHRPTTDFAGTLIALALAALALAATPGRAVAAPNDPSGTWLVEDGRARIRMEKCGPQNSNVCGYVVWLKTPLNDQGQPKVDLKNPDVKKRARPALGHQLVMGAKPNADSRYEGKIYNSEDGKSYDVTIWTEQPTELSVRGCMLGFLCGSQTWTRVSDVAPGQITGPTNGVGGPRSDAEWLPKPAPAAAAAKPPAKPAATPTSAAPPAQ